MDEKQEADTCFFLIRWVDLTCMLNYPVISFKYFSLTMVVAFLPLARIMGERSTINSPPEPSLKYFSLKWRLAL